MRKLMAVVLAALCMFAHAQSGTSPNLVYSTVNPWNGPTGSTNPGAWTGFTTSSTVTGGGYSGGSQPAYNPNTGTFYFGYTQSQIAYTYAFSQALQNSGMTITGYNYSWDYLNQDTSRGNLSATLNFAATNGTSLYSKSWSMGATTQWTTVSGTETFTSGLLASNISNFSLKFSGKDDRYWAGYYGPQVKVPTVSLNYTFDPCSTNPLSSPTCAGYAQALLTQQCTANPLYDPSCPGYAQALLTQQCTADPLINPQCPGYATAYLTYQCNQNPLYSTTCSGYDTAYFNQQCNQNPLYSTRCAGYDQAYLTQQCNANPLYSASCSGYARAYHDQQCNVNPLYATDCAGYATAYLNQQCSANPLYSTQCSGYAVAYKNQQCSLNALYATDCPGYAVAYKNQQCSLNALYSSDCAGYGQAYFNQQCGINPLYNVNCTGYTQAFHDQQCAANPLYASDCVGYAAAYKSQQCTLNSLYATDCPNYASAYFTQQCNLNGLYDQKCPNYATAYAKKMVLEQQGTASIVATAGTVAAMAPQTTATVSNDGTVSTTPSATGSAVVDKALPPPPSANSAANPTAAVQLAPPQKDMPAPPPPQERKPEGGSQGQPMQAQGPNGEKPQPTARQQLAERRAEAAKKDAVEKGKNLANEMGKAADMESQKQIQNVVIQAMGFTPGFDTYNKSIVPDVVGYKPFTVYNGQVNVDNKRLGYGLYGPSDRLHNDLVGSQYKEE